MEKNHSHRHADVTLLSKGLLAIMTAVVEAREKGVAGGAVVIKDIAGKLMLVYVPADFIPEEEMRERVAHFTGFGMVPVLVLTEPHERSLYVLATATNLLANKPPIIYEHHLLGPLPAPSPQPLAADPVGTYFDNL